jgi:hypothetical protein
MLGSTPNLTGLDRGFLTTQTKLDGAPEARSVPSEGRQFERRDHWPIEAGLNNDSF